MAGSLVISTLNNDTGVLATQNGMSGIAKAWVCFNGNGEILGSFNISSVVKNYNGNYDVNFAAAMPDTGWSCQYSVADLISGTNLVVANENASKGRATNNVNILISFAGPDTSRTLYAAYIINVTVFR